MPKNHAPIFKVVKIDDTSSATAGDVLNWGPNTSQVPGANEQYAIITTTKARIDANPANPGISGHLQAEKVWNSVWNDYADFQLLNDELIPGKCYMDTADGARICTERCQLSVIGVASDTFAQVVGKIQNTAQVPIAVAGWVLAFVDREYPCGTPLTNDEQGNLTEMTKQEKMEYPERLVAVYKRKEHDSHFGTSSSKIVVNNRHWVKVK